MKAIILIFALVGLSPCLGFAQAQVKYIVFYKPFTDSSETNLYRDIVVKFNYDVQYSNLVDADIRDDVRRAIKNNDFRVVSISGFSYLFPGLEGGYEKQQDGTKTFIHLSPKYKKHIDEYGFKVIKGTNDVMRMGMPSVQGVAYGYAKLYNKLVLRRVHRLKNSLPKF